MERVIKTVSFFLKCQGAKDFSIKETIFCMLVALIKKMQ